MSSDALRLDGLDGANPLGFLALLGTARLAGWFASELTVHWEGSGLGWRPVLSAHGCDRSTLCDKLARMMADAGPAPFDLDTKLPFARRALRRAMVDAAVSFDGQRRAIDLLSGLGSDAFTDKEGEFEETALRMTRSGDAAGQGLPHYVLAARHGLTSAEIDAMLFSAWRYDDDCLSLRWDPVEDQRYALRPDDPSQKANKRAGSRGVRAANAMAAEALAVLPVQPQTDQVATTGFCSLGRRTVVFTWPIWTVPCTLDVMRSVLSDPELSQPQPNRNRLAARGVAQAFRSERFASSKYYKNFSPARPV